MFFDTGGPWNKQHDELPVNECHSQWTWGTGSAAGQAGGLVSVDACHQWTGSDVPGFSSYGKQCKTQKIVILPGHLNWNFQLVFNIF